MILNHIMQKKKRKGGKNGKVYMLFADLKAVFDNVDRDILWEELKRKGVKKQLIERMGKIYEETEVMVKTTQGYTKFKTRKGVRQGCVIILILFDLYLAEIDKRMKERGIGGVGIGRTRRIWSLAYADDIVLIVNNREAMQDTMSTFKHFLAERKLELCANKTKMLVFNKKKKEMGR